MDGGSKPPDSVPLKQFRAMSEEQRGKISLKQRKRLSQLDKKKQLSSLKEAEAKARAESEMEARLAKIGEIHIAQDTSLPSATVSKIKDLKKYVGERVKIFGWVHRLRQGKRHWFVELRDGTGFA